MSKPTSSILKDRLKRVRIATITGVMAVSVVMGAVACNTLSDITGSKTSQSHTKNISTEEAYANLQEVRKTQLETHVVTWTEEDGSKAKYLQANEEDVLELSKDMSVAIEDYFKACGATDWVSDKEEQFWPEDIEYIVTAIAFNESSYRTNCMNDGGKAGITGIYKSSLLKTLDTQWLIPRIWGNTIPQVNCNPKEVDIFNPTTCLELTYENIGYNLANRFKEDKDFIDIDGQKKCVWDMLEYSEELQIRLVVAAHRFGLGNVINSIYGRNYNEEEKRYVPIEEYIYGGYVNSVMEKALELEQTYGQGFAY